MRLAPAGLSPFERSDSAPGGSQATDPVERSALGGH
jgi:hypothetical protein